MQMHVSNRLLIPAIISHWHPFIMSWNFLFNNEHVLSILKSQRLNLMFLYLSFVDFKQIRLDSMKSLQGLLKKKTVSEHLFVKGLVINVPSEPLSLIIVFG